MLTLFNRQRTDSCLKLISAFIHNSSVWDPYRKLIVTLLGATDQDKTLWSEKIYVLKGNVLDTNVTLVIAQEEGLEFLKKFTISVLDVYNAYTNHFTQNFELDEKKKWEEGLKSIFLSANDGKYLQNFCSTFHKWSNQLVFYRSSNSVLMWECYARLLKRCTSQELLSLNIASMFKDLLKTVFLMSTRAQRKQFQSVDFSVLEQGPSEDNVKLYLRSAVNFFKEFLKLDPRTLFALPQIKGLIDVAEIHIKNKNTQDDYPETFLKFCKFYREKLIEMHPVDEHDLSIKWMADRLPPQRPSCHSFYTPTQQKEEEFIASETKLSLSQLLEKDTQAIIACLHDCADSKMNGDERLLWCRQTSYKQSAYRLCLLHLTAKAYTQCLQEGKTHLLSGFYPLFLNHGHGVLEQLMTARQAESLLHANKKWEDLSISHDLEKLSNKRHQLLKQFNHGTLRARYPSLYNESAISNFDLEINQKTISQNLFSQVEQIVLYLKNELSLSHVFPLSETKEEKESLLETKTPSFSSKTNPILALQKSFRKGFNAIPPLLDVKERLQEKHSIQDCLFHLGHLAWSQELLEAFPHKEFAALHSHNGIWNMQFALEQYCCVEEVHKFGVVCQLHDFNEHSNVIDLPIDDKFLDDLNILTGTNYPIQAEAILDKVPLALRLLSNSYKASSTKDDFDPPKKAPSKTQKKRQTIPDMDFSKELQILYVRFINEMKNVEKEKLRPVTYIKV